MTFSIGVYCQIALICSCLFSIIFLARSVARIDSNQEKAFSGDLVAADKIILPCYRTLYVGLLSLYIIIILFLISLIIYVVSSDPSVQFHVPFSIIEYTSFLILSILSITPILLIQISISNNGLKKATLILTPWFAICSLLWGLSFVNDGQYFIPLHYIFVFIAIVGPILLCCGIFTKILKSRVQLGSSSNRNCVELLLIYSIAFGIIYLYAPTFYSQGKRPDIVNNATIAITVIDCITNIIFPLAIFR